MDYAFFTEDEQHKETEHSENVSAQVSVTVLVRRTMNSVTELAVEVATTFVTPLSLQLMLLKAETVLLKYAT